jgi:hypothetical protein
LFRKLLQLPKIYKWTSLLPPAQFVSDDAYTLELLRKLSKENANKAWAFLRALYQAAEENA